MNDYKVSIKYLLERTSVNNDILLIAYMYNLLCLINSF